MTLTEKRRSLDMSLGEAAAACLMKTHELSRIERGVKHPTDEECEVIGKVVGLNPDEVRSGLPTKEESERNFTAFSDGLLAMSAAMEDAKKRGLKRGHGGAAEIQCPICKGRLRYSVASVNGHCWGKCATPGCVSWMQ